MTGQWPFPSLHFFFVVSFFPTKRKHAQTHIHTRKTAFWYVAPCNLVEVYRRFKCVYCPDLTGDGGSRRTHIWNVGLLPRDYTKSCHPYPRLRQNLKSEAYILTYIRIIY
jgi:hypothetical protein